MQVSYKWLSELVDLSSLKSVQGLADLLTSRGLEVEEIKSLGEGLDQVVAAKILSRDPHPQADRLSLCQVSTGTGAPLQIVCGAQNMKAGDTVPLAQIGAKLPNGLKIEKSKIRGVESFGMLCSQEELGLPVTVDGLLILPERTALGQNMASYLGRSDTVLFLKPTANRGDCLSHVGVAREVAAALGAKLNLPTATSLGQAKLPASPVSIQLEAGEKSPQFFGALIEGVRVGPSPQWLKERLEAIGQRSINNIVDATNLILMEWGHPVHAYDASLIRGGKIGVRLSKAGEKLPLLDGTEVQLDGSELVVIDGQGPVGLAGVMGGGNSEVRDSTQKVFLECAEFDPILVRRASRKHGKRTEACIRFEKGIDSQNLDRVISRLAALVVEVAGGKAVAFSSQVHPSRDSKGQYRAPMIALSAGEFARFLGTEIQDSECYSILRGLGCEVSENATGGARVTSPSWRTDLQTKEDLADEVARTIGFDRIPSTPPALSGLPTAVQSHEGWSRFEILGRAKRALQASGLQEALNYSATSKNWLAKFNSQGQVFIQNPLTEDMEVMTPALIPLLVKAALEQEHHHFGSEKLAVRMFEIRPSFHAPEGVSARTETETGVQEQWRLGIAMSGPRFAGGLDRENAAIDFADVKAVVERLTDELGIRGLRMVPLKEGTTGPTGVSRAWFHPGQSVEILAGPQSAGFFGRLHPRLQRDLKIREPLWIAEFDYAALFKLARGAFEARKFKAWSAFPSMERDYALLVKSDVSAEKLVQVALKVGKPMAKIARVFDIYRGAQVSEGMTSVAIRVIFSEDQRSLQESETEAVSVKIVEAWRKECSAELRG